MKRTVIAFYFLLFTSSFGQIIYVDVNVSGGSDNGTSWANAYASLQSALTDAENGDQIWVANGTYIPSSPYSLTIDGDRDFHFEMKEGVAIYGGFAGGESQIANRVNYGAGEANETILSGDIGNVGVNTDNCYHVIFNPTGLTTAAILDGFTIKGGYADLPGGANEHLFGAGIYINSSSPVIRNCTFTNNYSYYGSGIFNQSGSGEISNCKFINNTALYNGGGIMNFNESTFSVGDCIFDGNTASDAGGGIAVWSNSSSTINDCMFYKNSADHGGGAWIYQSPINVTNCLFSGNTADYGGGIEINDCAAVVFNCTFGGNSAASSGGGMYNSSASPVVTNSIFWGNFKSGDLSVSEIGYGTESNFTYCCIRGGSGTYTGTGNIFIDPAFNDADGGDNIFGTSDDDFSLRNSSPCIGAGTNTGAPSIDILGTARGNPPDMGAYENSLNSPGTKIIYVDANVSGGSNNGTSWANAYSSLQSALSEALIYDQIWVANGTYYPSSAYDLTNTSRYYHFEMINDVKIYGGFAGSETAVSERNNFGLGEANETILSGDIGAIGTDTDNCYHVIYNQSSLEINNTAALDGFTITKGYSDGGSGYNVGGGMSNDEASPKIYNCTFTNNYAADLGGGMNNLNSSPEIINCTFISNSVTGVTELNHGGGGAIDNYGSSPTITGCVFKNNSATDITANGASGGGAIYNEYSSSPEISDCFFYSNSAEYMGGAINNTWNSSPTIFNCVFTGNSADIGGGLASQHDTSPILINCSFSGNNANSGGGVYVDSYNGTPTIKNVVFWGDYKTGTTDVSEIYCGSETRNYFSYCCIQGGTVLFAGAGNVYSDPLFTDADGADNVYGTADDDLSLQDQSSCINMGTSTGAPPVDILGLSRDSSPDIGAYEYQITNKIYYVDAAKIDDSQNGTSWGTAKKTLQAAITLSSRGSQIWVKAGTYTPTNEVGGSGDRYKTFQMKNGVEIYGGFAGTESSIDQRANHGIGESNETILSGIVNSSNCYHLFYHPVEVALNNSAVLDGFTISGGSANGSEEANKSGGAMYNFTSSPVISNCSFVNNSAENYGGAIFNTNYADPSIDKCTFKNNSVSASGNYYGGGGISNYFASAPDITACIFIGNSAYYGGGIENWGSSTPTITNCLFNSNSAVNSGGAIYNRSLPVVMNCTFTKNSAANGGAICSMSELTPKITNSIFWGDFKLIHLTIDEIDGGYFTNITHCCIQNGSGTFTGAGNIFLDPLFTDADGADNTYGTSDDDLSLQDESPCIGAGTSTDSPATDIINILRGAPPDIGAYENGLSSPLPVELVSFTASINNSMVTLNWQTATEVNNYGFEIERKSFDADASSLGHYEWKKIGFIEGSGNSNSIKEYSFVDEDIPNGNCSYRLKQIDIDGSYSYSEAIEITLNTLPATFELCQNYPNPFNPTTVIGFQLPVVSNVQLKIFDVLGNEVVTLVNEEKEGGHYEVEFNASGLASGIYFYRLSAGSFVSSKKMLLLK